MNKYECLIELNYKSLATGALAATLASTTPNITHAKEPIQSVQKVPVGIRNNNPGNIEHTESNNWDGLIGTDGRFCKFSEMIYGVRAIGRLLITYQVQYNLKTIREIITKWAPPKENNTEAYIKSVVKTTGILEDQQISVFDLNTMYKMTYAIILHENGKSIDFQIIKDGAKMALNK